MIFKFCDSVVLALEKEQKSINEVLIEGNHNLESYKFACGRIKGIESAIVKIKDFVKKIHAEGEF